MSGLQGYSSPATPRMSQSPGQESMVPSSVLTFQRPSPAKLSVSSAIASMSHAGAMTKLPGSRSSGICTASISTGFLRNLAMRAVPDLKALPHDLAAERAEPFLPNALRDIAQRIAHAIGDAEGRVAPQRG